MLAVYTDREWGEKRRVTPLMRAVLVMIVHVRSKHSSEMFFTQNDHVVETLAPD